MMVRGRNRAWLLLVVLALFGAACSGEVSVDASGSEDDAAADDAGADDESTDDESSDDGSSDDESADDSSSDDSSSDDGESSDDGSSDEDFTGAGSDEWCGFARQIDDTSDELDFLDPTDPASIEELFERLDGVLDDARGVAPPDIADDVALLADTYGQVVDLLREADYDFLAVDQEAFEALDTPEVNAAGDRIEAFNVEVCGIEPDTSGDDGTSSDDSTTFDDSEDAEAGDDGSDPFNDILVDSFVAQGFTEDEARCVIDGLGLDPSDVTGLSDSLSDPTALLNVFTDCGISEERLLELGG